MTPRILALTLFSVALSAMAQMLLKAGMSRPEIQGALPHGGLRAALLVLTNRYVIAGLTTYALGAMVWLLVLARVNVGVAYPFVGLGFVLTMFLGAWLFHEPLTVQGITGTLLVAVGVVLIARAS